MGVDVSLWRARIGLFSQLFKPKSCTPVLAMGSGSVSLCIRILLFMLLAMQCVELNPGPLPDQNPVAESEHSRSSRGGGPLNSGATSSLRSRGQSNMPFEIRCLRSDSSSTLPTPTHHNVSNISFGATSQPPVDTRLCSHSAMSGISRTEVAMEIASARAKCHVSKLISRAMKLTGTSSYASYLSRNRTLIMDYLHSTLTNMYEIVQGGSYAEGTFTKYKEKDRMIIIPDITVHTTNKKPKFTKGHSFLLDEVGCSPGYGRLRVLKLEHTDPRFFDWDNQPGYFRDLLETTTDGRFLSSEKMVTSLVSTINSDNKSQYYRHGPCVTAKKYNYDNVGNPDFKIESDTAQALVCDEWPTGAHKWITRKRRYDWPPKDILEKISKMKCHVVPIGNKRSNNFSLEWRISFLVGERELVWSFNNTQVHCYVLLKLLIQKYIEPIAPDQLSSYHLKTVMFWMSEEQGMSMWYDENLLGCVTECLDMLLHCVKKQKLQHYFYKDNNLLDNKFNNESEKELVLQKIAEIQADIEQCVCECEYFKGWDIISQMCNSCHKSHKSFIRYSKNISYQDDYEQAEKENHVLQFYGTMSCIFSQITAGHRDSTFVFRQLMSLERNPPEDVSCQILERTQVFIAVRLGMSYFGHISALEDVMFQKWIKDTGMSMQQAYISLCHGRHIDSLSGTLYLASIYLCKGKFSLSNYVVLFGLRQNKFLVYPGLCSTTRLIHLTEEGQLKFDSNFHLIGKEERPGCAHDVWFNADDVNCVPYPVKFECALAKEDPLIMIHPCVYAICQCGIKML